MAKPIVFFSEVREELKRVVWPKQNEVIRLTLAVILISVVVGLFIGGIDLLFTKITEVILK